MNKIEIESNVKPELVFKEILEYSADNGKNPTLLILGGAQKGAYSGGGVMALSELKLSRNFGSMIGISTGSPVISYFAANQAEIGTTIYFEENTNGYFINFFNFFKRLPIVDIDKLAEIFYGNVFYKNKGLNIKELRSTNANVYYVVSNANDHSPKLLELKELDDPILAIKASCAMPVLYNKKIKIGQHYYIDGGFANIFPFELIQKTVQPTSLLIFANRSREVKMPVYEKLFYYLLWVYNKKLSRELLRTDKEFKENLSKLYSSKIPFVIVWCDDSIGLLDTNSKKIKKGAENFRKFLLRKIKKAAL